jgi:hypothetical protein
MNGFARCDSLLLAEADIVEAACGEDGAAGELAAAPLGCGDAVLPREWEASASRRGVDSAAAVLGAACAGGAKKSDWNSVGALGDGRKLWRVGGSG